MFKRFFIFMVMAVLMCSTLSVAVAQEKAADVVAAKTKEMVTAAKGAIKMVSPADVKKAIDSKEKAVYLDVRDAGEFAAGHLPGAVNVSRGTLEFKVAPAISDLNAKVYVYCATAMRSALATKTLNDLGYKNAVLMDAHYAEWVKAGYPVER
jgi:rhodanese-related sulfurtransferase